MSDFHVQTDNRLGVHVRMAIDLNRLVSMLQSVVFESVGDASTAYPLKLLISTQKEDFLSATSSPRSLPMTPSGAIVSEYLCAQFLE